MSILANDSPKELRSAQGFLNRTRKTSIGLIRLVESIEKNESERKRIQKHLDSKHENELFVELYENVENFFEEEINIFEETCTWYQISEDYDYSTSCGYDFQVNEQTAIEAGMRFCPSCSLPIEESVDFEDKEE
jgi:hypothetical protein